MPSEDQEFKYKLQQTELLVKLLFVDQEFKQISQWKTLSLDQGLQRTWTPIGTEDYITHIFDFSLFI
jgi:hypothetical protein